MFCTNVLRRGTARGAVGLALLVMLAGCASTPDAERHAEAPPPGEGASADAAAEWELGLYRQALAWMQENRLRDAETALAAITTRRPELAGPWVNRALIHIRLDKLDRAAELLDEALKRNPVSAPALNLYAHVHKERGDITQARHYYLRALSSKPDYALAHHNLAVLYDVYLRDIPQAVRHYRRYLELTGFEDQRTADWLGELERTLGGGT